MIYRTLGNTGLRMPIMGMGTGGGPDPLGQASGIPEREIHRLLHRAFDLGITYFDTSPGYMDSEVILGRALQALPREDLIVSTKIPLAAAPPGEPVQVMTEKDINSSVDQSLRRLGMEYVDIMLIAVSDSRYFETVVQNQLPILQQLVDAGKIRHLGSSELSRSDGSHEWLQKLLPTGLLGVAMVAHNMINQSAQETLFPYCLEKDIGVMNVFTVRKVFGQPGRLREVLQDLIQRGLVDAEALNIEHPLDFLLQEEDADSLIECAYRYAAYTPGVTTVLNGANEIPWLEENVANVQKGPLSDKSRERLKALFGRVAEPIGN